MLKAFRTFGTTKVSRFMLILLVVCFGAWGIGDYLTKQIGAEAITVNGQGLSVTELDRLYKGRMQQLQNMMGGRVAPEVLKQLDLPRVVMTEAVNRAIMRQTAYNLGLLPAPDAVRDEILAMPEFQSGGKFSAELYQSAVARAGLTTAAFETSLGQDMSVRLLGDLVKVKAPAPQAVATLLALEQASYGVEWLRLTPASLPVMPEPTQAELEAFLTENNSVFMSPERRDVLVLPLRMQDLAAQTDVTDEQITAYYDSNKTLYEIPEKRLVRHVLVETEEEAKTLRGQITSAEQLTALAAEKSLDTASAKQGGSLGMIAKDDVVDAFGEVAFKLGIGEVSTPVQTPFGWHIIVVEKIEPAHTLPLTEVRDAVVATLKDQEAQTAMFDVQQQVDDKISAGMTLAEIGKDLGLKVQTLNRLAANDELLPKDIQAAAFSVQAGEVAAPVEETDGNVTYVQATSVTPAQDPVLAEVKDRVLTAYAAVQKSLALKNRGVMVQKAFAAGETLEAAALKAAVPAQRGELSFTGAVDAPQWLHPSLTQLMQVPTGGVLPGAILDGDDVVLVRLASRTIKPLDAVALEGAGKSYAQRLQQDYEGMLIGTLSRSAKVKTNLTRLKQVFGDEVTVP